MDDKEIIELYWKRDERAIDVTVEKYGESCYAIAFHILQDMEDAEECWNDTLLNAWNSIPPRSPENLFTYLRKLIRNNALKYLKKRQAQKRGSGEIMVSLSELEDCISDNVTTEERIETKILEEKISLFLRKQPKEKRDIFILRYWHIDSIEKIAKRYGMSENKVRLILFRMREKLRQYLECEGFTV